MQASPSSLQQPSRRHARWHVPEASLKVCISFRKVLSAAAGAPQVCSLLTATCQASYYFSLASTCTIWFLYRGALTFMLWPSSCRSALYSVTPGEPRANTAPRVTADAGIVYRVLDDMLLYSTQVSVRVCCCDWVQLDGVGLAWSQYMHCTEARPQFRADLVSASICVYAARPPVPIASANSACPC